MPVDPQSLIPPSPEAIINVVTTIFQSSVELATTVADLAVKFATNIFQVLL